MTTVAPVGDGYAGDPLGELLSEVRAGRVDVIAIALAEIVAHFLSGPHSRTPEARSIGILAGSILSRWKATALIDDAQEVEVAEQLIDARSEGLLLSLIEKQLFASAANALSAHANVTERGFLVSVSPSESLQSEVLDPLARCSFGDLRDALVGALDRIELVVAASEATLVTRPLIDVRRVGSEFLAFVSNADSIDFGSVTAGYPAPAVIVCFIIALEAYSFGAVVLDEVEGSLMIAVINPDRLDMVAQMVETL
ncbi:MAG: hypothetical protein ACYDHP_12865 [Ferrimicrobium sp.]